MIVFRRKKRDQIVINGNIVVTVMNVRGSRVSLGIEAPEGVRILRSELKPYEQAPPLVLGDSIETQVSSVPAIG